MNPQTKIIKHVVESMVEGSEDLYLKIPFFMRTRLGNGGRIDNKPWAEVRNGCLIGDEASLRLAQQMYYTVFSDMLEYIHRGKNAPDAAPSDNVALMIQDYHIVKDRFKDDSVEFVTQMALCLEKEKEFIEQYSQSFPNQSSSEPNFLLASESVWGSQEPRAVGTAGAYDDAPGGFSRQMSSEYPGAWMLKSGESCAVGPQEVEVAEQVEEIGEEENPMELVDPGETMLTELEKLVLEAEQNLQSAKAYHDEVLQLTEVSNQSFEQLEQLTENPEQGMSETELPWAFETFESLNMNRQRKRADKCQAINNALQSLDGAAEGLESFLQQHLRQEMDKYRRAEALKSVSLGPKLETTSLQNKFNRFGCLLNTILCWLQPNGLLQTVRNFEHDQNPGAPMTLAVKIANLERKIKPVVTNFFSIALIVIQQPTDVIGLTNNGSKKAPNHCTKKRKRFTTSIRILGAEAFSNLHILKKPDLKVVFDKDRSECKLIINCEEKEQKQDESAVWFCMKEIHVSNFTRQESNNVYRQFLRLHYSLEISLNGETMKLETLSLPIMFNTGANQLLECVGARMWYIASVENLYGDKGTDCPDRLPVDKFIEMLNMRVRHIHKNGRALRDDEKEFLKSKLPSSEDNFVTLQSFIKEKVKGTSTENGEMAELGFSFCTWFLAVMNSLGMHLSDAWHDGVIYGFCGEKGAESLLMQPNVPVGTTLFRPSCTYLQNPNAKDATAFIIMQCKKSPDSGPGDHQYEVKSVPLSISDIEKYTFYKAVTIIEDQRNRRVAHYIYGINKPVSCLKKYSQSGSNTSSNLQVFSNYKMILEEVKKLKLRDSTSSGPPTEIDSDSGPQPSPRKRRLNTSTSYRTSQDHPSISGRSSSQSSGDGQGASGSTNLPAFSELSSVIKQEPYRSPPSEAGATAMTVHTPDLQDSSNHFLPVGQCVRVSSGLNLMNFNGIFVDTSNLKVETVSNQTVVMVSGSPSPPHTTSFNSADPHMTICTNSMSPPSCNRVGGSRTSPPVACGMSTPPSHPMSMLPRNSTLCPTPNIPTVVNEAPEPKHPGRRQKGAKKSSTEKQLSFSGNFKDSTASTFNGLLCNNSTLPVMNGGLFEYDEEQAILEQAIDMQQNSPTDSGLGEMTPSPTTTQRMGNGSNLWNVQLIEQVGIDV